MKKSRFKSITTVLLVGLLVPTMVINGQQTDQKQNISRLEREYKLMKEGAKAVGKRLKGQSLSQEEKKRVKGLGLRVAGLVGLITIVAGGAWGTHYYFFKKGKQSEPLPPKKQQKPLPSKQPKQLSPEQLSFEEQQALDTELVSLTKSLGKGIEKELSLEVIIETINQGADDMESLIAQGANVNQGTEVGVRPISLFAFAGNKEVVDLLLKSGAYVNIQDRYGSSPLHAAVYANNTEMAEFLLQKDAKVNLQDEAGRTPLHLSTMPAEISWPMFQLLLDNGADKTIRDQDGNTPEVFALKGMLSRGI